jgi:hypothetical protein
MLALMLACSAEITGVEPAVGSARGGDQVLIQGDGLSQDSVITFGGVPAALTSDDQGVWATTPPGIAGTVDVLVEGGAGLEDAFTYEPLTLTFVQAAAHYLPDTTGLIAGHTGDVDGDGTVDVVAVLESGSVVIWRGSGTGAFTADEPVLGQVTAAAVADLDGDGTDDVLVCGDRGELPRVLGQVAELPDQGTACASVTTGDLDGDGLPEVLLVEDRGDHQLHVWWNESAPGEILLTNASPGVEPGVCGTLAGGETTCELVDHGGGYAAALLLTGGATTMTLGVPDPGRVPNAVSWSHAHEASDGQLTVTLIDAEGVRRSGTPVPVSGGGWTQIDQVVDATPVAIEFALTPSGGALAIELDDVRLGFQDGGSVLIEGFELWTPHASWSQSAHDPTPTDVDDDGDVDLILATSTGPVLLEETGALAFQPGAAGRLAADCAVGGLAMLPGADVVVTCPDQDRLLRNDGGGWFFDDTAASMPLDDAHGTGVAAADLDLDGHIDLLIGAWGGVDRLYTGTAGGFHDDTPLLSLEPHDTVAMLPADVDGDGDLDVLALDADGGRLYVSTSE